MIPTSLIRDGAGWVLVALSVVIPVYVSYEVLPPPVLDSRTTTAQNCEAVPRRARIEGS
jgi:hypothetical protein